MSLPPAEFTATMPGGRSSKPEAIALSESIGKYRVVRKLGEGSTGQVYLCRDSFADREVAVKLIQLDRMTEMNARVLRHLLMTEASLVGKLSHPHIVQIFDAVLETNRGYIVMEYVTGGTLEPHCHQSALLKPERVVHLIFKCTRALEYARARGVIHRDIKPANLLLINHSDVKISDFGSAVHAAAESTLVTGVGSPAYMSPEQIREEELNHQTDIYSLGVVMFQLLTGQLPFTANNHYGLMYQIAHGAPLSLSALRPDLPAQVERIVHRAMEKDRTRRYQSWAEFSFDLATLFETAAFATTEVGDSEKFSALRALPFFAEFSDSELWEVLGFSVWLDLEPEQRLIEDGEEGDFFCILASGRVRVTKRGKLLSVLHPGDCFGEMAYLHPQSGHVRGADVTTMAATRLLAIHAPDLRRATQLCQHRFDRAFLKMLVERLSVANDRLIAA